MIDLYTTASPNGWKISVALEEMELEYAVHLPVGTDRQARWYRAISPGGRVPAIVDRAAGGFAVFESGAILIYLGEKTGQLMPLDVIGRSRVIQWLMWQMAGIGPMMGQANVFNRYWPQRIDVVADRYVNACRGLFEVLDEQLAKEEYIAGSYSIADIETWCWVRIYPWPRVPADDLVHVQRWLKAVAARPAVQRGVAVPFDRPVMVFDRQHEDLEDERDRTVAEGRRVLGFDPST
jgi:GSH-dependent disulfide-bond oxidoreductase